MGDSGGRVYDFESAWRRNMVVPAVLVLAGVGLLGYGAISGRGPDWGFGLAFLAVTCVFVLAHVFLVARRVVVDGDRFTVTTWGRQRTAAVEDITHTSWIATYRLLQYRGGMVLIPSPLGLGGELVRDLKTARPRTA